MKKLLIGFILSFFMVGIALADCTVTVNWTASVDPDAAEEEVWYDPDNSVGADEIMVGGPWAVGTTTAHAFIITSPVANDEVYIKTYNAGRTDSGESSRVTVGGVAGGVVVTVTTVCMP